MSVYAIRFTDTGQLNWVVQHLKFIYGILQLFLLKLRFQCLYNRAVNVIIIWIIIQIVRFFITR